MSAEKLLEILFISVHENRLIIILILWIFQWLFIKRFCLMLFWMLIFFVSPGEGQMKDKRGKKNFFFSLEWVSCTTRNTKDLHKFEWFNRSFWSHVCLARENFELEGLHMKFWTGDRSFPLKYYHSTITMRSTNKSH